MSRTRTYKITDRATGEVLHNVPSDELLATTTRSRKIEILMTNAKDV